MGVVKSHPLRETDVQGLMYGGTAGRVAALQGGHTQECTALQEDRQMRVSGNMADTLLCEGRQGHGEYGAEGLLGGGGEPQSAPPARAAGCGA